MEPIRRDKRGRIMRSARERAWLIAEFERSDERPAAFAREHGVAYQTFMGWLARGRTRKPQAFSTISPPHADSPPLVAPPVFARLELDASSSSTPHAPLVVELPGGARLRVADAAGASLAAALIRELLQSPQPCSPSATA